MNRFFLVSLIAVVILLSLLGACSQSSPAPSTAPKATSTTAPAPATTSASATSASAPTSKPATAPVAEKPIELRFGYSSAPVGATSQDYLNPWAKKIEEATKGRVKVTIYAAESLFKANLAIESTTGGVADIAWTVLGYYPGRFPLTTVLSLPYLNLGSGEGKTEDGRVLEAGAMNSHLIQELFENNPEIQAEFKDVKVLYLYSGDPPTLMTTKKVIRKIDDLKGLKMRELAGYPSELWKNAGASPMLLAMPDVYDALQKGVIDGGTSNWAPMGANRHYEILKYWSDITSGCAEFAVVMNKEKWNSLPPDIQQAITSVSGMAGAEFAGQKAHGDSIRDSILATAEKAGYSMQFIAADPGELDKLKKIAAPLWDKWVAEMNSKGLPGQKVLDTAIKNLEKHKK